MHALCHRTARGKRSQRATLAGDFTHGAGVIPQTLQNFQISIAPMLAQSLLNAEAVERYHA